MAAVSVPAFWQDLYERGGDGWELGHAHPSLEHVLDTTPPTRGRVAVPGCGRGHDARLLAARGWDVVGFDFADAAIDDARRLARAEALDVTFEQRDVFTLGVDYAEAFDGVWEYTCFCAIDPGRRAEYVSVLASIVKPGGWFLACFYPLRSGSDGPPFPVSRAEIFDVLSPAFGIERACAPPRPVPRRMGLEWMVYALRTDVAAGARPSPSSRT